MKHHKEKDYERGVKHGNEGKYAHPPNILDNLGGAGYVKGKEFAYKQRINNPPKSNKENKYRKSSNKRYSGGGGGGGGSDSGCGGCGLVILAIIFLIVIGAFISNTGSYKPQISQSTSNNQLAKAQPILQNINSYFEEKFMISASNALNKGDEGTIVDITLKNMTNVKTKVLFSSGQSISNLGNEQFVPRPFLRDEHGNEYLAILPVIHGEAVGYISDDDAWGNKSTVKVGLPPNSIVTASIIFPKLNNNVQEVTLTIPGVAGWQTDIVIPKLKVILRDSVILTDRGSNQDQIRSYAESNHDYVNPGIVIINAGVAEGINNDNPIGEATIFRGNGRYDRSSRDYVMYFAKFSGAIPERTRFKAKMFFNGNEDSYLHNFPTVVAKDRNGTYSAPTGPYYLVPGIWEIRLFADEQEVSRTKFEIVSGQ